MISTIFGDRREEVVAMSEVRRSSIRSSLKRILLLSTALLISAPTIADAQDIANERADATEESAVSPEEQEIIVERERNQAKAARKLAEEVTRSLQILTPLERFRDPICPLVMGAEPQTAFTIESRIKANAQMAGLDAGGKKCQHNMLIAFVADAREELKTLLAEKPRSFGLLTSFERKRLNREDGPTRAWHVWVLGDRDGNPLLQMADGTFLNIDNRASNIFLPSTRIIQSSVVLIERAATEGKTLEQIADFATMRGLMPVEEIESEGHAISTILSLFEEDSLVSALTEFDIAYLKAYHLRRNLNRTGMETMFEVGKQFARPEDDPNE